MLFSPLCGQRAAALSRILLVSQLTRLVGGYFRLYEALRVRLRAPQVLRIAFPAGPMTRRPYKLRKIRWLLGHQST